MVVYCAYNQRAGPLFSSATQLTPAVALTASFVPISGVVTAANLTTAYLNSTANNTARFYCVNVLN